MYQKGIQRPGPALPTVACVRVPFSLIVDNPSGAGMSRMHVTLLPSSLVLLVDMDGGVDVTVAVHVAAAEGCALADFLVLRKRFVLFMFLTLWL